MLRETCRRLERERDNEMKWHHQTHKELVETQCKLMDITQERDEARGLIQVLRDIAERLYELASKNNDEWEFEEDGKSLTNIRAELDQIKEVGK